MEDYLLIPNVTVSLWIFRYKFGNLIDADYDR